MLSCNNNVSNNITQPGNIFPNIALLSRSLINAANTHTTFPADQHLKHFEPNFSGPTIIVIKLNESNTSTGSWHPLKWTKFLSKHFPGINNIKPNGYRKVKVLLNLIHLANTCLNSPFLLENNLSTYILSTLIFSYRIMKLDISFPEADF